MRRIDAWRVWRRATGKQRALVVVAVVVLLSGALAPLAYQVYAAQRLQAGHAKSTAQMPDPRARAQRFQRQHFGKQKPTAAAYAKARAQAAKLPQAPLTKAAHVTSAQRRSAATPANPAATPANLPGMWQPTGPSPVFDAIDSSLQNVKLSGDVTAVAVNPADANDIWIGASAGGVWHSTDGGTTWAPMTDGQATLAIGSVAIDPKNPNTIYAGTGDANSIFGNDYPGLGVLKTSDSGQTWTLLDTTDFAGLAIGKIAVDPVNPQVLLLSAGWDGSFIGNPDKTGIWRSTDGGATWIQTLGDPGQLYPDAGTDVVFDPANPTIAYAGLGNLYALNATTASGVYKSTDNGQHWTQITTLPMGSDVERVSLTISPGGTSIYAALTDGDYRDAATGSPAFGALLGLYRSADGGTTWAKKGGGGSASNWWYASLIAIDPSDSSGNTVYVGNTDLSRSTDGLTTSTLLPLHFFQHTFSFVSPSSPSFYVGTEGGVWSGDNGTYWTGAPTGNFVNRNGNAPHGLAIGRFDGGSIGTSGSQAQLYGASPDWSGVAQYPTGSVNGPAQWNLEDYYAMPSTTATLVDYANNANVYVESRGSWIGFDKSTCGGCSWQQIGIGTQFDSHDTANYVLPFVMSPTNPNELFVASDRVYKNFTPISPVLDTGTGGTCATPSDTGCVPISSLAVAPSDDKTIYVGDDNGNVFATIDGGTTWSALSTPCSTCGAWVTSLAIDPTNAKTVYATLSAYTLTGGNHVFKSTDGGASWADISTSLPNAPAMSVAVNPSSAGFVVVATDAGIFASQDAGATWGQLGVGLPNVLPNQVFFSHDGARLFVATDGRGVWALPYAHLDASPAAVTAASALGINPGDQTLTLQNTGSGTLNWSQSSTLPSWLSISATSGSIPAGGSQPLTLHFSIDTSAPAQTYSTTLTFTDPAADNSGFQVPVTLDVSPLSAKWYFAEGFTGRGFDTKIALANPNPVHAHVTITYHLSDGAAPVQHANIDVAPYARLTDDINAFLATIPATASNNNGNGYGVATEITADVPVVAERVMYFNRDTVGFDVMGATHLAHTFYFDYLDDTPGHMTLFTVLNPTGQDMYAHVTLYSAGTAKPYTGTIMVPANARGAGDVNRYAPPGLYSGVITLSSDAAGTQPLDGLVERPMYWTNPKTGFYTGEDVIGAPSMQTEWDFAEGWTNAGGANQGQFHEYLYLANPSDPATGPTANVTVIVFKENDTSGPIVATYPLPAGREMVVDVGAYYHFVAGNSVTVESDQPILAERLMTWDYGATDVMGAQGISTQAFFAEGYTGGAFGGFTEILTLENPTDAPAHVTITYLPANDKDPSVVPPPVTMTWTIPAYARSGFQVNPYMPNQGFSTVLVSDQPILAERVMYFNGGRAGTDAIGYQGG